MERYSHLLAELSYKLAQFVPGPYCRKLLISSCFLFYNLLCKSKRALFWKIGTVAERESNAIYRFSNANQYRALSPRNGTHRHMYLFFMQNGNNVEQFIRRINDASTIFISLRPPPGQNAHIWMNTYFESDATGLSIAGRFQCEFTYRGLWPNYEWSVCTITWHSHHAVMDNWNQLFHFLHSTLRALDNGNEPLPINGV
uniref:CUB domain-containing protein n=1 Tax=Globodera pallida TaxID=36090 RepID=A0A183BVF6_GLOPA